jgi:hypothetical protein
MRWWRVSEWSLLNANSEIFQLYHGKNKLIFNEMMMSEWLLFNANSAIFLLQYTIISLKINLLSPWYSWKISELALNYNHSLAHFYTFRYNSGGKKFSQVVSTKHLSVSIDAVVIHNSLWKTHKMAAKNKWWFCLRYMDKNSKEALLFKCLIILL